MSFLHHPEPHFSYQTGLKPEPAKWGRLLPICFRKQIRGQAEARDRWNYVSYFRRLGWWA